jgi:aminodeoxyfutalosine synthase|tara:strand:+ start:1734 stop:2651 length:918 start_codon:yes stop_codon:yes gene_type:complete
MSDDLSVVTGKIADGIALDEQDVRLLVGTKDLLALGTASDDARRRRHADRVSFVQVHDVPMDTAGFEAALPDQAGEARVTGRPESVAAAVSAIRAVVARVGWVPVTGFTLADLQDVSGHEVGRLGDVLTELRDAGLALVTEAAAEKLGDPQPVFEVLRECGLTVGCLTLGDAVGEAAILLLRRIATWDGAGTVCRSVAPLPRVEPSPPTTGYSDLRQVALARLLVDNIDSIQVDWARHGPKLAQVALTVGADDVDAVPAVVPDDLGRRRSPREEVRRNIVAAGFVAVRRNGCFQVLDSPDGAARE